MKEYSAVGRKARLLVKLSKEIYKGEPFISGIMVYRPTAIKYVVLVWPSGLEMPIRVSERHEFWDFA